MENKKVRFNIWTDEEDIQKLKRILKTKGMAVSTLIRMYIKEFIAKEEKG